MKAFALSTGLALGLGALALTPANAAPLSAPAPLAAPGVVSDVACQVVTKRVRRANGTVRVTRERICDRGWKRPRYRDRRVYRPAPRPGLSIRVNP